MNEEEILTLRVKVTPFQEWWLGRQSDNGPLDAKRCPFCGGVPMIETLPPGHGDYATLSCQNCNGFYGNPTVYVHGHTDEDCVRFWNRRTPIEDTESIAREAWIAALEFAAELMREEETE